MLKATLNFLRACFLLGAIFFVTYWLWHEFPLAEFKFSKKDYTMVEGRVISARLSENHRRVIDWGNRGHSDQSYLPLIEYKYTYQGKDYQSTQYSIPPILKFSKSSAEVILKSYQGVEKVAVFINPDKPHFSLLNPQFPMSYIYATFVWVLPFSFLCIVLYLSTFLRFEENV
jgi:Protein of unknown function (DUF3592)